MHMFPRRWFNVGRLGLLALVLSLSLIHTALAAAAATQVARGSPPQRVGQITEYRLPKGYGEPWAITTGPDGKVWFTDDDPRGQNSFGWLNPHTEQIRQYGLCNCVGNPPAGLVSAPDGNLWAMSGPGISLVLGRINPHTGHMQLFSWQFNYAGLGLTVGSDGDLWLLESSANNTIDRFSLSDHSLTQFAIPTPNAQASSLVTGPDGNLWFTETAGNKLGRLNPKTGQFTEYALPYQGEGPETITPGPRGDPHLWFVAEGWLGWINPFTGQISQIAMLKWPNFPALSAGPDGHLWLSQGGQGSSCYISRATPSANILFNSYLIPTPYGQAQAITAGPDGNLWFTELYNGNHFGNKIGMITTH